MLEKQIEKATINLIYDQPMLGNIAVTVGGVKAISSSVETISSSVETISSSVETISSSVEAVAYTDGKGIYFNKDYIKNNQLKLKAKMQIFINCVELLILNLKK